jgi:hypothetical protein
MQIVHGVEDARGSNQKIAPTVVDKNDHLRVEPVSNGRAFIVDFDVAVVVSKKTDVKAAGGVEVYVFDAGVERATSAEHTTTSRIKFQVPITFDDYADVS